MPNNCPPNTFSYIIKPKDTLYNLAIKYNTTVGAIISANPFIDPMNLKIGETICIPKQKIYPPCPENNYYTIKFGETLYSLAQKFNISLDDLIEANPGINPLNLLIGQVICIPLATPPVSCPNGTTPYVIKSGDTFYSIATSFNVTVNSILDANPNLNPYYLLIGQRICIPKSLKYYSNTRYNAKFLYPSYWNKVEYGSFEGDDGFFIISAISGSEDIDEVCRKQAFDGLNTYGTNPKIIKLEIENQPACLIIPSNDQPPEMREEAILIIKYPSPITIDDKEYNYFILYADKNYIKGMGSSFEFLS